MTLWFTARGAGLSALILLSLSTCIGAVVSRHTGTAHAARRFVLQYLHRAFAGLGLLVLVLHVSTIVADSYVDVGLTGALIPFTSGYRPTPVALGSLAAYPFLGVAVLGVARGRMAATERGARVWRRLHALAYGGWGLAVVHGFTAGTDSSVGWVRAIYVVCLVAVLGAVTVRLLGRTTDVTAPSRPRSERPATASPVRPARVEVGS